MKLIDAIATDSPREVTTKYGQRTVIDAVSRDSGEKITLWRPANDSYSRHITRNSPLSVAIDSKGKYSLIENEAIANLGQSLPPSPVPVEPIANQPMVKDTAIGLNPVQKQEIAQYVTEMADLYKFCLDQAEPIALTVEDARAIATTLFIAAQKKFAL